MEISFYGNLYGTKWARTCPNEFRPQGCGYLCGRGQAGFSGIRASKHMYYVYVLEDREGRRYKGLTSNVVRRLKEHQSGSTKSTKHMQEIRVVYQECFDELAKARKREVYLKSAAGRRFLNTVLQGPVV